jgi:hypothetical protein
MLGTLLSSLTSLQTFVSRAFFIGAFIPTLLFAFLNGLLLYLLHWGVHDWLEAQFFNTSAAHYAVVFATLFLGLWIAAFIVAALTPWFTRTMEGRNWGVFRKVGIDYERWRFQEMTRSINEAVRTYGRIEAKRAAWRSQLVAAHAAAPASPTLREPTAKDKVQTIQGLQEVYATVPYEDLDDSYTKLADDIRVSGITPAIKALAESMPLLVEYAVARAQAEHSRVLAERNSSFGIGENIAPTEFGNVGLTAEAYALRAYKINLPQIWGALRQAAQKDDKLGPALEDAKMQLDFLVASYFLVLIWAAIWAVTFAMRGQVVVSAAFAVGGPLAVWGLWYGAAVERYRVLQDLITSLLDGLRFQVLTNLHLPTPIDLEEERALWRALDFTVGNGQPGNLRYRQTTP